MKQPHTRTNRGKRVRVELKNGEVFIDRFLERTPKKWLIFESRKVRAGDVKAFSDVRAKQEVSAHRRHGG
jgi:hypothetical protein